MNEFKNFIICVAEAIALMLTIIASVGAINWGIAPDNPTFYAVAGVINLIGWGGLVIYQFYKKFIKHDE